MTEKIAWHFSEATDQQRSISDSLTDSKFNINPFASFTREIIQNSLDAIKNEGTPVRVEFEIKEIDNFKVPGLSKLIYVLERCIASSKHIDTINKYEKALEVLNSDKILTMKVSDFNTKGMNVEQFNALLNYEGKSVKNTDHQAGRHGVGKKASFLMSLCNTVFYSTRNIEGNSMFQGKVILTNWEDDNGTWMSKNGWFGIKKNKVIHPVLEYEFNKIDDFFIRKNESGTDIVILGLRTDGISINQIKEQIITSVLENFFIGILDAKLEVLINKIEINKKNFKDLLQKYYNQDFTKKETGSDKVVFGLLKDYYNAYKSGPYPLKNIKFFKNDYIDIYFNSESEKGKKYYAFFRDHGMKIRDYHLGNSDQPFSCVVVTRGKEINEFLLELENAAHDDFIPDTNAKNYKKQKDKLNAIRDSIESWILDKTKLTFSDEYDLQINDMIDIVGELMNNIRSKKTNENKQPKLKSLISENKRKKTSESWEDMLGPGIREDEPIKKRGNRKKYKYPFEDDLGYKESDKVFYDVDFNVTLIALRDNYYLSMEPEISLKDVKIKLYAKNKENNYSSVTYAIDKAILNEKELYIDESGSINLDKIESGKQYKIKINLKNNYRYKLFAKIYGVKNE